MFEFKSLIFYVFVSLITFSSQVNAFELEKLEPMFQKDCADLNLATQPPEEENGYQIDRYKITYETVDLKGESHQASGLIAVKTEDRAKELVPVSYQHGTLLARHRAPSRGSFRSQRASCLFAKDGRVLFMPDYLGFGASKMFHPFLHAKSEGTATYDLIKNYEEILASIDLKSAKNFYIAGYSQGGHATLALQREIEKDAKLAPKLSASIPMAGPYALSTIGIESITQYPVYKRSAFYTGYILTSYQMVYGNIYENVEDVYGAEHLDVPRNFEGRWMINVALSISSYPREMLNPEFVKALERREHVDFIKALEENDLDTFLPRRPTHVIYASGDKTVVPAHTKRLELFAQQSKAPLKTHDIGAKYSHTSGFYPSLKMAVKIIEAYEKRKNR